MRQLKTYTSRERNMYLTAMFGQNMIFNVMSVFTNYFARDVLLIPAMTVGIIMTIAQVWDAVNDPIMGTIVDKTRTKYGKCRPYLMWTPGLIYLFIMLCFLAPPFQHGAVSIWSNVGTIAWALGFYMLFDIAYTAGDIPLWGITLLMTEDEKHRQKLQSNARIVGAIGGGMAMLLFQPIALWVGPLVGSDRWGSVLVAFGFTTLGFITFQMAGIFVREKIVPVNKKNNMRGNLKMMWGNKPFRQVIASGVLGAPRGIVMLVAIPLVTYYFASKDPGKALLYTALLGGGVAIGMFPAQIMAPKLLSRFGKRNLYVFSCLVSVPFDVLMFVLYLASLNVKDGLTNPFMTALLFVLFLVKGVTLGLNIVLQTAMVADAVDYEDYVNDNRPDGVFFSGLTFVAKIGNGMSTLIYQSLSALVGLSGVNIMLLQGMLDNTDMIPRELMRRGSEAVVYSMESSALSSGQLYGFFTMMFFAISIIPAIANLLSVIPVWKYSLTGERYAEILDALQARRRERGELVEDGA
ncbi:MAG: MFS transporter [Oscillospiraceae bacterium]|nr:MFS transporter [Oscillospiraceae bacterium]